MEIELQASIAKVTLSVKAVKGVIIRKCLMAFDREFDAEIAAALGSGAKKALAGLRSGEMEKVVLGIEAIEAKAIMVSGDQTCGIDFVRGQKATCVAAADDEGDVVTIRLEFECSYADEVWSFLGRNCGAYVRISFSSKQLELSKVA